MPQRFAQQLRIGFTVQFGHLRKSGRGFLARFSLFAVRAGRIILKDADGVGIVAVLDEIAYVGLHVARGNAPGLFRKQHGALAAIGHCRPELPVKNLAVRLRQDTFIGHLVFVRAENLPQVLDFLVHAVEHLAHSVDFHFAALEAFQREPNCQVFSKLHNYGVIRLGTRRLRGQACERLLHHVLRAARQLRHLLLEHTCRGHSTVTCPNAPETRQRAQNRVNFFLARLAATHTASAWPSAAAKRPWDASRQASHHIGHLYASIATAGPKAPDWHRRLAGPNCTDTRAITVAAWAAFEAGSNAGT